jgi:hypothetical protein
VLTVIDHVASILAWYYNQIPSCAILYAQVNENYIREEIKSKLKSRDVSYYSVKDLVAAILL